MRNMMSFRRFAHSARLLLAGVVAMLTLAVVAPAVQTITTPNAASYSYYLAAGAYGSLIYPVTNVPVFIMGTQIQPGYRGVGQVTLLHVPGEFVEWTGLESPYPAAITSGYSATNGTHIVYFDYSHQVDLEVYSADYVRVHNSSSGTRSGYVTLIW